MNGMRESGILWEGLEYHNGRRVTLASDPIATQRDCVLTIGDDAIVSYFTAYRPEGPGGEVVGIVKAGNSGRSSGSGGVDQPPFYVVLLEARLMDTAPSLDFDEMERVAKSALRRMGFFEDEDYLVLRVDNPIDINSAADEVLSQGSSGPATHRLKKVIAEALSYDIAPVGHGLVYIGGVSEWPTGSDHGSYNYAGQDSQFRSFCYSTGYIPVRHITKIVSATNSGMRSACTTNTITGTDSIQRTSTGSVWLRRSSALSTTGRTGRAGPGHRTISQIFDDGRRLWRERKARH